MKNTFQIAVLLLIIVFTGSIHGQDGTMIPTNQDQKKLISAYRFVLEQSDDDYRINDVTDKQLFPTFGESSIYRILAGPKRGSFVYANALPDEYSNISPSTYSNYNWKNQPHLAIQFKKHPKKIAIFKSAFKTGEGTNLSWESIYFERLFSEFLMDNISYTIDEKTLASEGLDKNTELLIIPTFVVNDTNYTYYIDSIFSVVTGMKEKVDQFLSKGGNIYAEGNACYFLEKLGYLETGSVDYSNSISPNGSMDITINYPSDILSLGADAAGMKIYGSEFPGINSTRITKVASGTNNIACLFSIKPNYTFGGRVHCNTGLPTVSGISNPYSDNQQISWTLNSILAAFSSEIDVTRKVTNELVYAAQLGDNSISYDCIDTFKVDLRIRNLSNDNMTVSVDEIIKPYFAFVDMVSGPAPTVSGNTLTFSGLSIMAHSELVITYRLVTPEPDNSIHEHVDNYLDRGTLISVGTAQVNYTKGGLKYSFIKNKGFADILFSARIFADTDVNWKNFLGLFYQPFKVFMIMENKSRSAAENTEYVQFIPKDVPFYWVDHGLNIPILKTPGGKFVDVLRGSDDENNPEYDMDSDGDPDAWLDTTSIYPKGYKIKKDTMVYWANPWNHLRTDSDTLVFEDIDHDGIVPLDTDGDGIVDANFDEGDKIRAYMVTWDIGHVAGYEYYDPYCSFELWVDPPDFIPLSAGVGYAHDSIANPYPGMFYPYTPNISDADIVNDTTWRNWMEHNDDGSVVWKQLIHQRINNYEGFTFVDTSEYTLTPYDSLIGTAPQPRREFIAVLSLGGEEIDMRNYTPHNSLYSKVNYETVFGEEKMTPIRTTYSYWAPLPNPLQFEYLSNNYQITDTSGNIISELPEYGNAHLTFDMDASTEYTYYWIRNVGYDVDYNDPSEVLDTVENLGDGVFGYFVYSIPKGMGGYRITLPRKADGSYDTDAIVQIDGAPFEKWIDNPNTWNEVEIWETPFEYQVYIPQLLIPPALDDDNGDGIDDWIDDRGDRFSSKTGFLHDAFMKGDGEDYLAYPSSPFKDDIYGMVDSGWYAGNDNTHGDDFFETLGKTHITIHADYEGRGREGTVEISKGGVLVCEEIFGGSPWVIFSHVLSGFAKGTDISLESEVIPEVVYYGVDTIYLKHVIKDTNEPHSFDAKFDPYHISYGYGESTITTFVGAKDPCSLIEPAISMPAIVDPAYDNYTITLVPGAAEVPDQTDLAGYPRTGVTGSFIEVRVEIGNSTDDNWINTCVKPELPANIGSIEMSYVAYPRPLVPSHIEGNTIKSGDQPGTFTTGWRFNQPEGEVLIKMGDTLNLLQPTRRAYFVFLVKLSPALQPGIYKIPFKLSGERMFYDGTSHGSISYGVPDAMFSIVDKDANGQVSAFQKMVLDKVSLSGLNVSTTGNFTPTGKIKYANTNFDITDFASIPGELSSSGGKIDLSPVTAFPSTDTNELVIMQQGVVDSYNSDAEILPVTSGQELTYNHATLGSQTTESDRLVVTPVGPRVKITNSVYSINGTPVSDNISYQSEKDLYIKTLLTVKNTGTDISSNTIIRIDPGPYYTILTDSLDSNCSVSNGELVVDMGDITPGELKTQALPFILNIENLPKEVDIRTIIDLSKINYEGTLVTSGFSFEDPRDLLLDIYDFEAINISFEDLGNGQVKVSASAFNRGINGKNVWFRIYPVIGGGVNEFPFAELRKEDFTPGETIDLSGTYTLPNTDKSVEFIAIIDDARQYTEVLELNNSITIGYQNTGLENKDGLTQDIAVYPVPFNDIVSFKYTLLNNYKQVSIVIYNTKGQLVSETGNCPAQSGSNLINWRNSALADGTYIYQIRGTDSEGHSELIFKGQILKTSRQH